MIHQGIQNNTITINLMNYYNSRGWRLINSDTIEHFLGYSGEADVFSFPIVSDSTYNISFSVTDTDETSNLTFTMGGYTSSPIISDTFIEMTVNTTTSETLKFEGEGNFRITNLNISRVANEVTSQSEDTITFSQERNKWVTFRSIVPDCGFSMYTHLFTYKDGILYKHTSDATPNNFYGVQYNAILRFPISSVGVKTYNSISVHANKILETTVDGITTQLGQVSDLVYEDFQQREGVSSAIFYRDKQTGLTDGDRLKGRWIEIELTDEQTKEEDLELFKVVVKSNISSPNE